MLLPRHPLSDPPPLPPGATAAHTDRAAAARARHRFRTIDDPATRAELATLMDDAPMAFLGFAATTVGVHGLATPALVRDLIRSGYHEGAALAAALWWLCGLHPPAVLLDVGLPPWLVRLGDARLRAARRRREGNDGAVESYLLEIELIAGRVGTVHIQLDRRFDHAVVHAFAADQSLARTLRLFRAAARWQRDNGHEVGSSTPFRAIGVERAVETLRPRIRDTDRGDVPVDLTSPWPSLRSLLVFLLVDCLAEPWPSVRAR